MLPFASGVNRFFRFRQNFFFAACCSKIRFLKSRCRVMHPTAVSVNRFFRFPQNFFCRGPNRSGFKRRKANVVRRPLSVKHFLDFFSKKPASPRGALSWPKGRRQGLPRRSGFTPGTAARQRGRCPRWSKFPLGMRMLKVYGALVPTFKRASS